MGTAEKEHLILRSILDEARKKLEFSRRVTFIPVDFSYPLMMHGIKTTLDEFEKYFAQDNLIFKPYLADFTKLRDFKNQHGEGYTLITALGIVYNASIPGIFKRLRSLMTERTLLLIDAEMVGGRSDDELCSSYNSESAEDFFGNPLMMLGKAYRARKKALRPGQDMGHYKDYAPIMDEAVHITAKVVTKDTIKTFRETYDLPESAEKRIMLGPDPGSKTIALVCKVDGGKSYVLGFTTRFEETEFIDMMEMYGLVLVGNWKTGEGHAKYYLLRMKLKSEYSGTTSGAEALKSGHSGTTISVDIPMK